MSAAPKWKLVSVEEYLATQSDSAPRFEYIDGLVLRRPDERNVHNMISTNLLGNLGFRLRGKRWHSWGSETRIRVDTLGRVRFYHSDGSVIDRDALHDEPTMAIEVLSKKTRRVDTVEKKDAYLGIPALSLYLLVEQDAPLVVVFRRTNAGFVREVYEGLDAVLPLGEIGTESPLSEIYDGVEFTPEPDDED